MAAPKTEVRLALEYDAARPGQTLWAGLHMTMPKGWHTYWRNGGDAGAPTEIKWTLPAGVTAGAIQWPVPVKYADEGIITYVYHDEVVLLTPLTIPTNASPGRYEIKGLASWLECEKECVPGEGAISAVLTVADEPRESADAALLRTWLNRLPVEFKGVARARWASMGAEERRLQMDWQTPDDAHQVDFYPYASSAYTMGHETTTSAPEPGWVRLEKSVTRTGDTWPVEVSGVLVATIDPMLPAIGSEVTLRLDGATNTAARTAPASISPAPSPRSLVAWLLYAFVGGLILNIMPCVLPVIALKVLGFVTQSKEAPRRVRMMGLVYGLGVLASFAALAALVIAVKAAGHRAGWGMQFSNPQFLVVLTVLVTLIALNLFGVFEVVMSSSVMTAASGLAGREGAAGAFFNGVLATVLATPCTAPFLGSALGFAFTQSNPFIIVLIFFAVGLGLAAPYVALSWHPAWLRFLPKPGAWMERFKVAMGFPMLATAVWLFNIASDSFGDRVFWLGMFLVIVALAAWVYGEFYQRGRARRGLALGIAVALVMIGYFHALEKELRWRSPIAPAAQTGVVTADPGGIPWQAWSPEAVARARAEGRIVFVDFTAKWCATCQVNKKTSIEIASVREKLKELNAVALLGDYTRTPPQITDELNRFGRAGVPLVVVYPRSAQAAPIVLPELLTPQIVLNALNEAAR